MESIISAIIILSLFILLIFGMAQHVLASQAQISDATREMQERLNQRTRTDLTYLGTTVTPLGDYVNVTLKNSGSTKLANFDQWDVILQYTDGVGTSQVKWYTYSSEWNVSTSQPEVIEPGIFNPGEQILLQVKVSPSIGISTTNLATITTPNGISATSVFTR